VINLEVSFSKVNNNAKIQIKCGYLFIIRKDILCHLFFEHNIIQMLAATTLQVDHSEAPIFDDSFEHFDRYDAIASTIHGYVSTVIIFEKNMFQ